MNDLFKLVAIMTLKKRALAELFTAQLAITTGIVHWS